jgi:phenylacetate-coenzyme A ligase PaaK-like adenylate-forming protein
VGDLISGNPNDEHFMQEFETVTGRCNDLVLLRDGGVVHSEAFTHAVKEISSIAGFQVIQADTGDITLRYIGPKPMRSSEIAEMRQRLNRIHPDLADICIARVESLGQTMAGKTRRILRENNL